MNILPNTKGESQLEPIYFMIPLPVPNRASAEAQFSPNFSLHTKFLIGGPFDGPFEAKFFKKSLSSDMLDFWHFVFGCIWHRAKCICLCICVFSTVFVFFPFCLCLGRRSSLERLLSNSRVAFDHQNRHHHHQMNIRTQTRGKTLWAYYTQIHGTNTQIQRRSIRHSDAHPQCMQQIPKCERDKN